MPLRRLVLRVMGLTSVCGVVEVIGYQDFGRIYPAIMTGNTVELGWSFSLGEWVRFYSILYALAGFVLGCMLAAFIRSRLRHPALGLFLAAGVLLVAACVRLVPWLRFPLELPLLSLALGMQGEMIARFGAVSLQTLVVTNNIVRFSSAFVGRFVTFGKDDPRRPALEAVVLPGTSALTYAIMAATGTWLDHIMRLPFLVPVVLLLVLGVELYGAADGHTG